MAETMKERLTAIERQAREHGVAAGAIDLVHEVDNQPAEAIVRIARMKGCDLIVMSSHGRRGAARLLLGSQTAEVLARTALPVLVVR